MNEAEQQREACLVGDNVRGARRTEVRGSRQMATKGGIEGKRKKGLTSPERGEVGFPTFTLENDIQHRLNVSCVMQRQSREKYLLETHSLKQ